MDHLRKIRNFFSILFIYAARLIVTDDKKRITAVSFKRLTTTEE